MPRVDKRKMAGKAVVVSSDESQDDDSESSEQFFDGLSDESENDKYVDSSDEDKMDKVLFKLYRQQIVKKMKMKLINSSSHVVRKRKAKKAKGTVKSDGSFSRFSAKYFSEVVSSLSPHQRSIVDQYGFKNLLLFDSHSVPKKFAAWIASKVDLKTSEVILKDRVIRVTEESFRDILGLPLGGLSFEKNYDEGKNFILSKFGISSLPSVKYFGDLLVQKKQLSHDEVIISFLIVALACFLCPNSSLQPSVKYLTIFEDINLLESYDWCKFIYDWCMLHIKKFQKSKNLGGCLYYWAVLYLDTVDFGERNVAIGFPRMAVWKQRMIARYSEFDKIDDETFGLRPPKVICGTSNSEPGAEHDEALSFREKLDSILGDVLPDYLKDMICTMLKNHCYSIHIHNTQTLEDFVISVIKLLHDESVGTPIQSDDNAVNHQTSNANAMEFVHTEVHNSVDHTDLRDDHVLHLNSLNQSTSRDVQNEQHASPYCTHDVDSYVPLENDLPDNVSLPGNVDNAGDSKCASGFVPSINTGNASTSVVDDGIVECFGDVRNKSFGMDNETDENITSSSSQPAILFHSVEDTPNELLRSKYNHEGTARTPNCESIKKRVFQDITNSPDFIIFGESKFHDRCKKMTAQSDEIYNASNLPSSKTHHLSTSGGKIPPHGPRRVLAPAKYTTDPFVQMRRRFPISDDENRYFIAVCRLADSTKWQSCDAVNIDNVKVNFYTFGNSLKKGGPVSPFVMAVFCRVMFQNNHPSKSKKNYFFPSIGEQLVVDPCLADVDKVQRSFDGATKARRLDLCDILFFPIHYQQHWFLFIVDVKDRLFVFLDSEHEEHSEFFENLKTFVVDNFQKLWNQFVVSPLDFSTFKTVFPPVPRQDYECDSGVFVMKFMEIWSPRILLPNEFSKQNINNIRVKYVNQIFFHAKNKMLQTESEDVVVNWFDPEKFPRQQGA